MQKKITKTKKTASSYHPAIRILAIILAAMLTSGMLTYVVMFFINLFGG